MRVRVLAFARLRELLGSGEFDVVLPDGSDARALWDGLSREHPALADLAGSTRLARGGRTIAFGDALADDDEVALLPPYGGG